MDDIKNFLDERPLEVQCECFGSWDLIMRRCPCSSSPLPHKEYEGSMTFECCKCGQVTEKISDY